MTKAYLNALAEEGTREELIQWLVKLDGERDNLRELLREYCDTVKGGKVPSTPLYVRMCAALEKDDA